MWSRSFLSSLLCVHSLCDMWPCHQSICVLHALKVFIFEACHWTAMCDDHSHLHYLSRRQCISFKSPVSVLQVTGIMLPLLKFYFQEEVRQAAVQCIPDLLRSAYLAAQKGMQGADANYVRRMVDFIWGPLVEAIGKVLLPCMPYLGLGSGLHFLKPCRLSCLTDQVPVGSNSFHLPSSAVKLCKWREEAARAVGAC